MARIRKSLQNSNEFIWKLALYIRLSKEDNNEESDESLSVENQRKILLDYVEANFDSTEFIIVDIYVDDGLTGTDTHRANFMRMQQDIKDGKVNCVMVKSLARAFRNLADQQKFLEEFLPLYRVRFINLGQPFIDTFKNPKSASGLEIPIHGMFNEQFAASTSEEVRKTFHMKRSRGDFIGAFAPYGYKKDPKNKNKLLVDEEVASVVQNIFEWYLYGANGNSMNINAITLELNERGVLSPLAYKQAKGFNYKNPHDKFKENPWCSHTVGTILRNRMYIGDMVQGREQVISYKIHKTIRKSEEDWYIIEGTHEAIVSKELFHEVQKRLLRDTRTAPGKKEVHLFSGFMRCADCGRALHRRSNGYAYYYCRTSRQSKTVCVPRSIREDKLAQPVLSAIQAQIALICDLQRTVEKIDRTQVLSNQTEHTNALLKQHKTELEKLTNITDALYYDWKNGDISREEYLHLKGKQSDRITSLEEAVAKLEANQQQLQERMNSENSYFAYFQKHQNVNTLNRELLVDLIDVIEIHQDGTVEITFKFADQYQLILDYVETQTISEIA